MASNPRDAGPLDTTGRRASSVNSESRQGPMSVVAFEQASTRPGSNAPGRAHTNSHAYRYTKDVVVWATQEFVRHKKAAGAIDLKMPRAVAYGLLGFRVNELDDEQSLRWMEVYEYLAHCFVSDSDQVPIYVTNASYLLINLVLARPALILRYEDLACELPCLQRSVLERVRGSPSLAPALLPQKVYADVWQRMSKVLDPLAANAIGRIIHQPQFRPTSIKEHVRTVVEKFCKSATSEEMLHAVRLIAAVIPSFLYETLAHSGPEFRKYHRELLRAAGRMRDHHAARRKKRRAKRRDPIKTNVMLLRLSLYVADPRAFLKATPEWNLPVVRVLPEETFLTPDTATEEETVTEMVFHERFVELTGGFHITAPLEFVQAFGPDERSTSHIQRLVASSLLLIANLGKDSDTEYEDDDCYSDDDEGDGDAGQETRQEDQDGVADGSHHDAIANSVGRGNGSGESAAGADMAGTSARSNTLGAAEASGSVRRSRRRGRAPGGDHVGVSPNRSGNSGRAKSSDRGQAADCPPAAKTTQEVDDATHRGELTRRLFYRLMLARESRVADKLLHTSTPAKQPTSVADTPNTAMSAPASAGVTQSTHHTSTAALEEFVNPGRCSHFRHLAEMADDAATRQAHVAAREGLKAMQYQWANSSMKDFEALEKQLKNTYEGPNIPQLEELLMRLRPFELEIAEERAKQYGAIAQDALSVLYVFRTNLQLVAKEQRTLMEELTRIIGAMEREVLHPETPSFSALTREHLNEKDDIRMKQKVDLEREMHRMEGAIVCLDGIATAGEMIDRLRDQANEALKALHRYMDEARERMISVYAGKIDPTPVQQVFPLKDLSHPRLGPRPAGLQRSKHRRARGSTHRTVSPK